MSTQRTEAIVLRRTNYGEVDRIVQFITPNGKVSAIAKGVRKQKSKLAGGIELLAISDITLHGGRGDLAVVTSARLVTFFDHILGDYDRLQFAYVVLKDIAKASEQLDEPDFFDITHTALSSLNQTNISPNIVELWYRLRMASLLGVAVNLDRDDTGMQLVEDARYRFDPESMTFVFDPRGEFTSDHIKLLRMASVGTPEVVAHIKGVGDLLGVCMSVGRIAHE